MLLKLVLMHILELKDEGRYLCHQNQIYFDIEKN